MRELYSTLVYFDQLLGVEQTRKLVKTLFCGHFQPFLFIHLKCFFHDFLLEISKQTSDFKQIITEKH